MKSKKALFQLFKELWDLDVNLNSPGISNETYGRDSRIYINAPRAVKATRKLLENTLENHGFKVHRSYWPGSDIVEVSVSYFKGWHWDE